MCVAFSPEVIYKNAFYSNDGKRLTTRLQKRDIIIFCDIIEDEIKVIASKKVQYKYVYFDFNKSTLSSFFQAYYGIFTEVGNDIFLNEDIDPEEIRAINCIYDKEIRQSLVKAKKRFKIELLSK